MKVGLEVIIRYCVKKKDSNNIWINFFRGIIRINIRLESMFLVDKFKDFGLVLYFCEILEKSDFLKGKVGRV